MRLRPSFFSFVLALVLLFSFSYPYAQAQTPTATTTASTTVTVLRDANLRGGPGTTFAVVGGAKAGDKLTVVGRNTSGDWYELDTGAWIAAFLVQPATVTTATATPTRRTTPTATPTPTLRVSPTAPPPTATPQIIGSFPYTYTGVGDSIVDVSAYEGELLALIISGNHSSRHFSVHSYDADDQRLDLLVNTTDMYLGVRPLNLTSPSAAFLEVKAVGPWKIVVFPLSEATRIDKGAAYTQEGDYVLIVTDSSVRTAAITGNAQGRYFGVVGYSTSGSRQLLVNSTDPYVGTVRLQRDTLLLVIQVVGEWSIILN